MSLLQKMNVIFTIQSLFGLFTCKINNDKVQFSFVAWIYSFVLHVTITTTYLYMLNAYVLQDGLQIVFRDTTAACWFLQFASSILVYVASITGILFNTKKYARFFNTLNDVDRKVERYRRQGDKSEKKIFFAHFIITATFFLFYFLLNFNINSAAEMVSSICYGFVVLTIAFVTFFIRFIASILIKDRKFLYRS